MKRAPLIAVFTAGILMSDLRAFSMRVATDAELKGFLAQARQTAPLSPPIASPLLDDWCTPPTEPLSGARAYSVMSSASLPIGGGGTIRSTSPAFTTQPSSVTATVGQTITLKAATSGSPTVFYQWQKDGLDIDGAYSSTYSFTASAETAGQYTCTAANSKGWAYSKAAAVTVKAAISPKMIGSFAGLIPRNSALNSNLGSSLQFAVTKTGSVSGKIIVGSTSSAFTGVLSIPLSSPSVASLSVTPIKSGPTLTLQIDSDGNVTGTFSKANTGSEEVLCFRNPWAETVEKAAALKGSYTLHFKADSTLSSVPQGHGFGRLTVTEASGVYTLAGYLPDGSKWGSSGFVGPAGEAPVYAPLYSNRGSFTGNILIEKGNLPPADNSLSGSPTWFKPTPTGKTTDTVYASGFGPVAMVTEGGIYTAPAKGAIVLGLPKSASNAQLVFENGGLDLTSLGAFTSSLTISNPSASGSTNTATIPTAPQKLTLTKILPATGDFSGSFTIPGTTRSAAFSGQIVTVSGTSRGYGFFLLPSAPSQGQSAAAAPKLSGSVVLQAP